MTSSAEGRLCDQLPGDWRVLPAPPCIPRFLVALTLADACSHSHRADRFLSSSSSLSPSTPASSSVACARPVHATVPGSGGDRTDGLVVVPVPVSASGSAPGSALALTSTPALSRTSRAALVARRHVRPARISGHPVPLLRQQASRAGAPIASQQHVPSFPARLSLPAAPDQLHPLAQPTLP